ncbi:MAG: prenyltransferase/squalene oxidase repeat-containing protein, partial [Planctomycetota bacterium]
EEGDANAPKVKGDLQTRINEAIARGVQWLKKRQDKNGSWGPVKGNRRYGTNEIVDEERDVLGPTAFSVYVLSKCGVSSKDGAVKKGMAWLSERARLGHDTTASGKDAQGKITYHGYTTYESAAIIMMLEAVYQRSAKLTGAHKKRGFYAENPLKPPDRSPFVNKEEDWTWLHDRVLSLTIGHVFSAGGARSKDKSTSKVPGYQRANGGWRYDQGSGDDDLSATQFALLGLRAASQAGFPFDKVAPDVWKKAADYVKSMQLGDGGFCYQRGEAYRASMDACGISSLLICKEQMELLGQAPPAWMDDSIKRGLAHLDEVFSPTENKGYHDGSTHHYYYLYGVERVGDLTGRKEFAGLDWYLRGAEFLLKHQDADGKWSDGTGYVPHDVLGTCFALLFLKRATIPVVTISEKDAPKPGE